MEQEAGNVALSGEGSFFARCRHHLCSKWFLGCVAVWVATEIAVFATGADPQWHTMLVYGIFLVAISPPHSAPLAFYRAYFTSKTHDGASCFLLGSSAFISWVFAKSIYNVSTLGGEFGVMGGFAYACYYITFLSVGLTAYRLRTRYGYGSLAEAINHNYGQGATLAYCLAVLFRLYQEIWSNSSVVTGFYGDYGSADWWLAACVSTAIPLVYTLTGGIRSAIVSDTVQAVLVVLLLVAMLAVVGALTRDLNCDGVDKCNLFLWNPSPGVKPFSLEGGLDLALTGLLQGSFSYGFFDAVLLDRAFLGSPRMMLKSFIGGGTVAAVFIFLFSLFGVYGNMYATLNLSPDDPNYEGDLGGVPSSIARSIGTAFFTIMNLVFLTSSLSTIDSTFSSTAKLVGLELTGFFRRGRPHVPAEASPLDVLVGRISMVVMAIVGTLPLLSDPSVLSATTVSGTIVMGLGPPVIFCGIFPGYRPLAFHMSFWVGAILGITLQLSTDKPELNIDYSNFAIGGGHYAELLGVNLFGILLCTAVYLVFSLENHRGRDFAGDERRWHELSADAAVEGDAPDAKGAEKLAAESVMPETARIPIA